MSNENEDKYSHTQLGWLTIGIIGFSIASIVFIMLIMPYNFIAFIIISIVLIILGISLILFSTMTVTCNRDHLKIRIGFIIHKNFPIKDIISCKVIKIPWYYGWGIRIVSNGWLYRVSGSYAVEINIKNGKQCLIGTDEPQKLADFLNKQLKK